jgi:hypothetical protein
MASILKVDTIQDQSGNNIINESADTITIGASGDTINIVGTLQNGGTNFLQGITEADQWRLTADTNTDTDADITTNWERVDTGGYGGIGTGLTESSGIFSFPTTGIWLIIPTISWTIAIGDGTVRVNFNTTTNNSTYNAASEIISGNKGNGAINNTTTSQFIFDVTNTSTHKFKFSTNSFNVGSGNAVRGNTSQNETCFSAIRLGDT